MKIRRRKRLMRPTLTTIRRRAMVREALTNMRAYFRDRFERALEDYLNPIAQKQGTP